MTLFATPKTRSPGTVAALAGAATLAALPSATTSWPAGRSADTHPTAPSWKSTASGCTTATGAKAARRLIHGNTVSGDDWNTSGVAELLLASHRVIIFDRPGFGYSERPRGYSGLPLSRLNYSIRPWASSALSARWLSAIPGAHVALALAQRHQAECGPRPDIRLLRLDAAAQRPAGNRGRVARAG